VVPPFKAHKGNWRPDYLLEKIVLPDGRVTENPRVCEINARLPWNALIAIPHIGQAFEKLGIAKGGLSPAMSIVSYRTFMLCKPSPLTGAQGHSHHAPGTI
jgi:hypothetical protein